MPSCQPITTPNRASSDFLKNGVEFWASHGPEMGVRELEAKLPGNERLVATLTLMGRIEFAGTRYKTPSKAGSAVKEFRGVPNLFSRFQFLFLLTVVSFLVLLVSDWHREVEDSRKSFHKRITAVFSPPATVLWDLLQKSQ